MTYDPQVVQRNADWGASENVYDLATNLQISGCISQETRTMRSAHRYFIRLKRTYNNVVEAQLATVAEFGCPQMAQRGNQTRPSWLLRLRSGLSQARLRLGSG
jgi:hypothetical protein